MWKIPTMWLLWSSILYALHPVCLQVTHAMLDWGQRGWITSLTSKTFNKATEFIFFLPLSNRMPHILYTLYFEGVSGG